MSSDTTQISEREREILCLVAMGATNQQIAQQLHISINTVKVHLRNIFEKIGVASRTEATVYAIRLGLVQLEGQPGVTGVSVPVEPEQSLSLVHEPAAEPQASFAETQSTTEAVAVATIAAEPAVETPERQRSRPRRAIMLAAIGGLGVLLVAVIGYLVVQRPLAPAASPTSTAPDTNRWKQHAGWPQPRANFAVAAYDGKIYAIGGTGAGGPSAAVDRLDPDQDQWVSLNDKPTPVTNVLAATIGGRIFIPGGEDSSGAVVDTFEAFDPRNQQWETLPALPQARSRYALAPFEGKLYLFGGWDGSQFRNEVFEYDPANKKWTERAAMPTARRNASAATVADHIYVIGGENQQGALRVNERFDPTGGASTWEPLVPLATPIATPAAVGTVNSVLVFDPQLRTAAQYTPNRDSWTSPVAIPTNTAISSRALPLGTSLFVFGQPEANAAGAVSEYEVKYQTLVPVVGTE